MSYILDASVVIGWFADQPHSAAAEPWLHAIVREPTLVVAPDLIRFEVHGALARLGARRASDWSRTAYARFERLAIDQVPTTSAHFARALDLARQLRIGGWDAVYLAHAEAARAKWLTADARVLRRLGRDARVASLAQTSP